ncbi:MAG: ribonuclease J [Candidatus Enteromonas sp.]
MKDSPINIFALGGLGEVGKNTYCFEADRSMILVDAGVRFPESNLPGVDYVIPDYTYLKSNRIKIKALFITHGHEDHIGGIPFLLRSVMVPVIYAPRLAAALIRHKLEDARFREPVKIVEIDENSVIKIGDEFEVSFFRVTHSIPDSFGLCIDTASGRIIETGDFKIDLTPVGPGFELDKLARLGAEGVDLLMADSTNAEIEGYTPSETAVRSGVEEVFSKAPGRIIVSTFSSNINRIQQVVEVAIAHGRKICVLGRSMKNVIGIAREYGYIKIPESAIIQEQNLRDHRAYETCIICTGSQGEAMAALSRIVDGDNRYTSILPGDTVVFSSNPIPGNGALVNRLVNKLVKLGADVKQNSMAFSLHSSGHPSKQELRLMQRLVRPKYFMPVHGEHRMLKLHGEIAEQLGTPKENIFICDNGSSLILYHHEITRGPSFPANDIYIDGNDLDGLNNAAISERTIMKNDGMVSVILAVDSQKGKLIFEPLLYTRGFQSEADSHVIRHAEIRAREAAREVVSKPNFSFAELKLALRESISKYIERKTDRRPMIVPVIMENKR